MDPLERISESNVHRIIWNGPNGEMDNLDHNALESGNSDTEGRVISSTDIFGDRQRNEKWMEIIFMF